MNDVIVETNEEIIEEKNNKTLRYSIWRLLVYFIIYSFMGFIIETIYGFLTIGVVESRRSFLYGPFSAIYGVGAVLMIWALQYFKKNKISLFLGGFLVGSIVEYMVSFMAEKILHVKWWDYSHMALNINGRICLYFSIFWGALGLLLICSFNPKIDKIIEKFKKKINIKILKLIVIFTILFMIFDGLATCFALRMFSVKIAEDHDLQLKYVKEEDIKSYENEKIKKTVNKYFNDKKMLMTFPNLKVISENGDIIMVKDILPDIQPYYYKIDI